MSVARPARCLFCSYSRYTVARLPRRQFHSTPFCADRKPKHENIKASEIKSWRDMKESDFKTYSPEEKARLQNVYSPEQIAAIEAGEKAIKPEEMARQLLPREDPWAFQYIDDFSTIEPAVDHHIRAPLSNHDPNSRLKEEDEIVDDIADFIENMPEDGDPTHWLKFTDNMRLTVGKEEAERNPHSALVPDIFEPGESLENIGRFKPDLSEGMNKQYEGEISPALQRLMHATGYTQEQIRGLRVKSLVNHDVVNQTRLGKIRKAYVLSVAGNGKGLLGIGEGKSEDVGEAQIQSQYRAIRNMQPILRYEDRTIYGDVKGKVGAVELVLMHRPPGFGLRCQHLIWEMCRVAGIRDLAARVYRSRNPMNTVKAAYQALMSQRNPEDIARARGKKLVDVRKVYYAGAV
ncbi:hypothetical protein VTO42DRAFT_2071 [Malbranchea cinnamomea]